MKIKIELTKKEIEVSLMKNHSMYSNNNPSGCCHCELCAECDSILSKVKEQLKDVEDSKSVK